MISEIWAYFQSLIAPMDLAFNWTNLAEICVIIGILWFFYKKFIKNTQSEKFVKGAFFLVFLWIFSEILIRFDLKIIGVFLKSVVTLVSLSLIVIFQPELRRFLGFLGQVDFINKLFDNSKKDNDKRIDVVKEIVESVKYFSRYDGAVVINGDKIISAGVLLPLTEDPKLSWKYGTRHRAAIGMSEVSDAACLVVSEETGDVSICMDGTLKKYDDLVTLKADLENILGVKTEEENNDKKTVFKINNFITIKKK